MKPLSKIEIVIMIVGVVAIVTVAAFFLIDLVKYSPAVYE